MKLDSNFSLEKYGLFVRFVTEEDAPYIVELRSDPVWAKHLHPTKNDVELQKKWIREYKIREAAGTEYYFIFLKDGVRVGLDRIYNFEGNHATSGSWICSRDLPFEIPLLIVVIIREIFFEILQLEADYMDTRKGNKKVIKMHYLLGAEKTGENEIDMFHILTRENYLKNKSRFLKLITG